MESKMINREIFIGFFVGLLANTVGLILAILFLHEDPSIIEIIAKSFEEEFLSKLISLGAIMNLFVFFVYINYDIIYLIQ